MLPQELRLVPFDAKCNKVSGKIMRIENEFVDLEILLTLLENHRFVSYRKIAN